MRRSSITVAASRSMSAAVASEIPCFIWLIRSLSGSNSIFTTKCGYKKSPPQGAASRAALGPCHHHRISRLIHRAALTPVSQIRAELDKGGGVSSRRRGSASMTSATINLGTMIGAFPPRVEAQPITAIEITPGRRARTFSEMLACPNASRCLPRRGEHPVNAGSPDLKATRDFGTIYTLSVKLSDLLRLGPRRRRSPFVPARRLGRGDAFPLPLQHQPPLEFGDCADHREDQLTSRRTGIAEV